MSIVSIFPVVLITIASLIFLFLFNKVFKIQLKLVKYPTIDGLRGYLAFFVFLHHSYVYYYFTRNSTTIIPDSNIFNQLGDTSVILFFMITGFLFTSKILEQKSGSVDWLKLYVSRILRIYPVYILLFCIQLTIIFYASDFKLIQPPLLILKEVIIWLSFSIIDYLPINGFKDTNQITANVLWTIRYELFFYCCLPIISWLLSKSKPSVIVILITLPLTIFIGIKVNIQPIFIYPFIIGLVTAFLAQNKTICQYASKSISSIIIISCLIIVMILFNTSYKIIPITILSITFIGIACGNNLFEILTFSISRLLGQLSYSIYLLHGIILYIVFNIIIGSENSDKFNDYQHWIAVSICSIIIILVSLTSFKLIENPAIQVSTRVTQKIKKLFIRS